MRPIFINGRFLTQPLTGVQRYAGNIVRAIDALVGEEPAAWPQVQLVTPRGVADPGLRSIGWSVAGHLRGHAWDQLSFYRASRSGVALGLGNSGPLLHPRGLVVLLDAAVYRHPEFFTSRYARAHQMLGHLLARRSRIATISDFSRGELADVLRLDANAIAVAPCAADGDGVAMEAADPTVVSRLGLGDRPFFLTLGNRTKNKNLALVVEALGLLGPGRARVVAVGDVDTKVFGPATGAESGDLIAAGRLDDADVAALMDRAQALIFPSYYEGFGIPPLEAMTRGCPVLASTAGAVMEVCGDAAIYFDPDDAAALARAVVETLEGGAAERERRSRLGLKRAHVYSWRRSALTLLTAARELART